MGGDQYECMDLTVYRNDYFLIERLPKGPGKRTYIFEIFSHRGGRIGRILWHGPWRQYVFFPDEDTIWSAGCLRDVQEFIERLMAERRGSR